MGTAWPILTLLFGCPKGPKGQTCQTFWVTTWHEDTQRLSFEVQRVIRRSTVTGHWWLEHAKLPGEDA